MIKKIKKSVTKKKIIAQSDKNKAVKKLSKQTQKTKKKPAPVAKQKPVEKKVPTSSAPKTIVKPHSSPESDLKKLLESASVEEDLSLDLELFVEKVPAKSTVANSKAKGAGEKKSKESDADHKKEMIEEFIEKGKRN